eukprot:6178895-Pleurochrysis_carterae.AAC.1
MHACGHACVRMRTCLRVCASVFVVAGPFGRAARLSRRLNLTQRLQCDLVFLGRDFFFFDELRARRARQLGPVSSDCVR